MQWCWLQKLKKKKSTGQNCLCELLSVGCEEEVRPLPSPGGWGSILVGEGGRW